MIPNAYDVITWRGKRLDRLTVAFIQALEERLGWQVTLTQGGYNGGAVAASAGTHDRGGVFDLTAANQRDVVKAARDLGAAAWYRSAAEGPWNEHIHVVMRGHGRLASGAARQVTAYDSGLNGLANNRPDPNPYRPRPLPVFTGKKDDEMELSDKITYWRPEGTTADPDKITVHQALNQAVGYARDAYAHARAADTRAQRIEKAISALAAGLPGDVEDAVTEALAGAVVEVDVNVAGGTK